MPSSHIGRATRALGLCVLFCTAAACDVGGVGEAPTPRLWPPPWTRARRAKGSIAIDGALDEPDWAKGPWNSWFSVVTADPAHRGYAAVQTRFRTLYDSQALYVGMICNEPALGGLKAAAASSGDAVSHDDCIELLLDPAAGGHGYHHLVINAKGAVASAYVTRFGRSPDARWRRTAAAQGAIDTAKKQWSLEVRIPFASMRFPPKLSDQWRFNVARRRYAGGSLELTSWSTVPSGSIHVPRRFGTLVGFHVDFRHVRRAQEPSD